MGICVYCGEPAGLLRRSHKECRERHDRAVEKIPEFFLKILANPIPVERFRELLQGAADASFIGPTELKTLVLDGITKLMASTLDQRMLTPEEEDRITQILTALGMPFDDSLAPYQMLVKVNILRDLQAGKTPDRVSLADPLPIVLRQGEQVIWAFNNVESYFKTVTLEPDPKSEGAEKKPPPATAKDYYGRAESNAKPAPLKGRSREAGGDLLVTSRNLYLLTANEEPKRIPVTRIWDMEYYANAVGIIYGSAQKVSRTILVDDPWFAVNLAAGLARHVHG